MRKQILYYAIKYKGEYNLIKKAIIRNEEWFDVEYNGKYITILDDEYPKILFELKDPPFILFYEGNLKLLNSYMVCIIGSRNCSKYADKACHDLIMKLPKDYVVISGLAKGIDSLAHLNAIELGYSSIGIIGCGCNVVYPKENEFLYREIKKYHLLLSEYPNDTKPLAHHFPSRNRLLACLSNKCYVVEAKSKSGTMITANYAVDLDREVIAFPYRYDDEFGKGCNELIEQGASIYIE